MKTKQVKTEDMRIGEEVSCVYFHNHHQAAILIGTLHEIVTKSEHPYIVVMAPDSSTHVIGLDEIRTFRQQHLRK